MFGSAPTSSADASSAFSSSAFSSFSSSSSDQLVLPRRPFPLVAKNQNSRKNV